MTQQHTEVFRLSSREETLALIAKAVELPGFVKLTLNASGEVKVRRTDRQAMHMVTVPRGFAVDELLMDFTRNPNKTMLDVTDKGTTPDACFMHVLRKHTVNTFLPCVIAPIGGFVAAAFELEEDPATLYGRPVVYDAAIPNDEPYLIVLFSPTPYVESANLGYVIRLKDFLTKAEDHGTQD